MQSSRSTPIGQVSSPVSEYTITHELSGLDPGGLYHCQVCGSGDTDIPASGPLCTGPFASQVNAPGKALRVFGDTGLALCRDIRPAAPGQAVVFCVHELKRPARNAAKLMRPASDLRSAGIQLELLTGPLTGIYDPNGLGALLFAVLAVSAQLDRDCIRDKTLEGQSAAAPHGRGGHPKVIDDDMLTFALALRAKGVGVPEIAAKLTMSSGKNAGKSPSAVSLYRALAEADQRPEGQPEQGDDAGQVTP